MLCREVPGCIQKMKIVLAGVLFGLCVMLAVTPVQVAAAETQITEFVGEDPIFYTALGDSIPNGYYGAKEPEVTCYPLLFAEDLHKISGREILMSRFTKNGLTTKKLNTTVLQEPEVQGMLRNAQIITLTIGSNDLMNEFKKVSREILNNETHFSTADEALMALQDGIAENPLLLMSVASAIGSWDYGSFEEQWVLAMDNICACRRDDAQMAVTTIYNPMEGRELPGTLNAVVESVISGMNEIMWKYAEEYGYQVVDLFGSGIEALTQSDGLHPNQEGQHMIRMLVENELDLDAFQKEKSDEEALKMQKELEEAAEKTARDAEQKRQQVRTEKLILGGGIAVTVVLILWGIFVVIRKQKRKVFFFHLLDRKETK